jgi:hypothetical protein
MLDHGYGLNYVGLGTKKSDAQNVQNTQHHWVTVVYIFSNTDKLK